MKTGREELRACLAIDTDALDECLVDQPALYVSVAEQYATAVAVRDSAKLDLEEATAELDKQFRLDALKAEEKITDTGIARRISTLPKIKKLNRDFLDRRAKAEEWLALKEGYQQRSFMLRELVALQLSQLNNLSLERGAHGIRKTLADGNQGVRDTAYRERRFVRRPTSVD